MSGLFSMMDEMVNATVGRTMTKMDSMAASPLKKFILSCDTDKLGDCVVRGSQISKELSNAATAICRRRFKWDEIILMVVLDPEEEGEAGIVFTEKGIYHWLENEEFVFGLTYEEIDAFGYQGDSVILTTSEDDNVIMFCGDNAEEEKYSRYMYNFIADIYEFRGQLKRPEDEKNESLKRQDAEEVVKVEGEVVEE